MDFNDTPSEASFRKEVREWLQRNVPTKDELKGLTEIQQCKLWQRRKSDAGWACIRWPEKYGGRNASAIEQVIWQQEESKYDLPLGIFDIGIGMAAPTLMHWGTDQQRQKHLPQLASGEHIWCQLFSEPIAGSDLAGIRSRAIQEGDVWVVNGQKIWTSGAHYSDFGIIVVRTDPTVPKHEGLTYFFVDMKSLGIDVKPIKQISGSSNFNEVFFQNVKIPDANRLGAVGQGWKVSITTLMNERAALGTGDGGVAFKNVFELASQLMIEDRPAIDDSQVRSALANWYCQESGLRYTGYRALTALSRGETPGPEHSISKLVGASKIQDMASFALDLLEMAGSLSTSEQARYFDTFLNSPGFRVAGGTDEIMLNILAERVLGLPQEVRIDKGIPFNEVPTSS
ncbi:MAG: acyl-CoA dehydrogenase [Gammaproteobacteria bacterium]|nr:acyl-CoA dehydrogenase [Gammaproteobacteria bacterium]MYF02222.1 acyl-CoA dehydrogenase [Gammaproteobacteria bacterium]MYI76926.1 acyl-CoA dehydrogenase [Gammaproteobacteria bacterium]